MKKQKIFSEEEVGQFVKATISETVEGVTEWLKNETDIINEKTMMKIKGAVIDMKIGKRKPVTKYVYPRLKKHGIKITELKPH